MNWDELFMRHVYLISSKSKDDSTQIGAVLVKERRILGEGFNGICQGVEDNIFSFPERYKRPNKYFWQEHGERNLIYSCARFGVSTKGGTCYTNGVPCADCGRALVQAGIVEVIIHKQWMELFKIRNKSGWEEGCYCTRVMFQESGIKLREYDNVLGIKTLLDRRIIDV